MRLGAIGYQKVLPNAITGHVIVRKRTHRGRYSRSNLAERVGFEPTKSLHP